ncbi:MAG TPA: SRPBCC family protein [Pseudolabrys sp.]|nr:SRPBCC family protein [Pseudolabrys sp.]
MSKPVFIYVTYIASTPEKVFEALTSHEATARFWFGNAATSDWKVGSPIEFHRQGKLIIRGKILENDSPHRLSYSFQAMHEPHNGQEPASRVLFELEPQKDQVKLTVTHDDFPPDSKVFPSISNGWPLVLSSMKSYIETNRVLRAPWYEKEEAVAS